MSLHVGQTSNTLSPAVLPGRKGDVVLIDGVKLKNHRRSKRMTQEVLASAAGVTKGYISQLEKGRRDRVSAKTAVLLAYALDIKLSEILSTSPSEELATGVIPTTTTPESTTGLGAMSLSPTSTSGDLTEAVNRLTAAAVSLPATVQRLETLAAQLDLAVADAPERTTYDVADLRTRRGFKSAEELASILIARTYFDGSAAHIWTNRDETYVWSCLERGEAAFKAERYRDASVSYGTAFDLLRHIRFPLHLWKRLLVGAIWASYFVSDTGRVDHLVQVAVKRLQGIPGMEDLFEQVLYVSAMVNYYRGRYAETRFFAEQLAERFGHCGTHFLAAAVADIGSGQWAGAETLLHAALEREAAAGRQGYESEIINALIWLYIRQERFAEAIGLCVNELERLKGVVASSRSAVGPPPTGLPDGPVRGVAHCIARLAEICYAQGEWAMASWCMLNAIALFNQLGDLRNVAQQHLNFALLSLERDGAPDVGMNFASQYAEYYRHDSSLLPDVARGKRLLGKVYTAWTTSGGPTGKPDRHLDTAKRWLQESVQEFEGLGNPYELGLSRYELAVFNEELAQRPGVNAKQHLAQSRKLLAAAAADLEPLGLKGPLAQALKIINGLPNEVRGALWSTNVVRDVRNSGSWMAS